MDDTLVALSPSDMPAAQTALVAWCDRKIEQVQGIVADLKHNFAIATKNRWSPRHTLAKAITREEQRIAFYGKIKAAVEAGYLIIPNFPVDAFAVRVREGSKPRWMQGEWRTNRLVDAQPQALPAGEGHYVDDQKVVEDHSHTDPNGKAHRHLTTNAYDEDIDFPLVDVKPVILQAAERAMALRIFDSIGVVRERKKEDPILVGTVYDHSGRDKQKRVTFFLAWWLDLESL